MVPRPWRLFRSSTDHNLASVKQSTSSSSTTSLPRRKASLDVSAVSPGSEDGSEFNLHYPSSSSNSSAVSPNSSRTSLTSDGSTTPAATTTNTPNNNNKNTSIVVNPDSPRRPPLRTNRSRPRFIGRMRSHDGHRNDDNNQQLHSPPLTTARKHRFSFNFWPGREPEPPAPAALDCIIESPPVVFHGAPETSTGALVSGQLVLEVKEDRLEIDNLEARLVMRVTQKKPYQTHCAECATREEELKHWSFLRHPVTLSRGVHRFPFSNLMDGSLPVSTDTSLIAISYELKAEAIVAPHPATAGNTSVTPVRLSLPVHVSRSLPETDAPHHSVRIFPPTNVRASAHYQQVLYATGKTEVTMSLDGLTTKLAAEDGEQSPQEEDDDVIVCWKLKRANWRLEETVRTTAHACTRHDTATPQARGAETGAEHPRTGTLRTETRVLAEQSIPRDWKSDYLTSDGHVDLLFDFAIPPSTTTAAPQHHHLLHHNQAHPPTPIPVRYACDTAHAASGTQITHSLMVELVVSRARTSRSSKAEVFSETGAGRILRMRFRVSLSEQPGRSVAWDDEAPPLYADVPPSPPGYVDDSSGASVSVAGGSASLCSSAVVGGEEAVVSEAEDEEGDLPVYAARNSVDLR